MYGFMTDREYEKYCDMVEYSYCSEVVAKCADQDVYVFCDDDTDAVKFKVVVRFDDMLDPDYELSGVTYKIIETGV